MIYSIEYQYNIYNSIFRLYFLTAENSIIRQFGNSTMKAKLKKPEIFVSGFLVNGYSLSVKSEE